MGMPSQKRARHALAAIEAVKGHKDLGRYRSYVQALPASILMNGLGQAVAAELAGSESGHKLLADQLAQWLCCDWPDRPSGTEDSKAQGSDLIRAIIGSDQAVYVELQAEAMLYLDWLKKFATAFLPKPQGSD